MKTDIHLWSYLAHFFLEWEMFQIKVVERIETHILCSVTFSENCAFDEITSKNLVKAGQATDNNVAHAHCVLDT